MFFKKIGPVLGSSNLDVDSNRIGWERSKILFESLFALIEAGVILGALSAAVTLYGHPVLWALYACGYLAMGVYVLMSANYLTALAFHRFGWTDGNAWPTRLFWLVTAIFAISVPYAVDLLASEVILAALGK
jgi:hypothetical protein